MFSDNCIQNALEKKGVDPKSSRFVFKSGRVPKNEREFILNVTWLDSQPDITWAEIESYDKELEAAEPMILLRIARDKKLTETDWWAAGDRMDTMTNDQKIYRKALRDLPSTATPKMENGRLTNVTWPTKPE